MEMEQNPPIIAKKLWRIVRIVFLMLRKGISKSKLMLDLHTMLKRGKLAGKAALRSLHHHHHHSTAAGNLHYEFSCSNSPAVNKGSSLFRRKPGPANDDSAAAVNAVQRVLEILNSNEPMMEVVAPSPLFLPGFGRSPIGKQLRITDSPFPARESDDDKRAAARVNEAADRFINKFYNDLKMQKNVSTAFYSPYHDLWN